MRYPEEFITEVREANDIVEVVSNYVSLKKGGANYKGLCPFHSEKTPSFTVSPSKQIFHCFGCGEGGNVIHFMMKQENMGFPDALRALAERCGKPLPQRQGLAEDPARQKEKTRIFEMHLLAADFFRKALPGNKAAVTYLQRRGISEDTVKIFGIGFAPDSWNALTGHLEGRSFKVLELERAGLALQRNRGDGVYDRFRNRVIFPIVDQYDRVLGFGGRVLDDSTPKYLNSPQTPIFDKGSNLYGMNLASQAIRKQDYAVIVEGYMDVITAHQAGIRNVVAPLGTALTERHLRKLRRYTRNLALFFDADAAGFKAAERCFDLCVPAGMKVKVITLPAGEDPDSFIRAKGREGFSQAMSEARPIMDFMIEQIVGDAPPHKLRDPEKIAAAGGLTPLIAVIPDPVEQDLYLEKLADLLGVQVASLHKGMEIDRKKRFIHRKPDEKPTIEAEKKRRIPVWEAEFVRWMIKHPEQIAEIEQNIDVRYFSDDVLQGFVRRILGLPEAEREENTLLQLLETIDPSLASKYSLDEREETDIQGLLERLHLEYLEKKQKGLQAKLEVADKEGRNEEVTQLLQQKNQLKLEVESLRRHISTDRRERKACPSN